MRDSDELASSGVLRALLPPPRCGTGTGALGPKCEFLRPLPNLPPSLGRLTLSSFLVCVAIKHLSKKQKADLISACTPSVCPLLIVRHCKLCDACFSISSR